MDAPGLVEFTVELETRPMVSLDPHDLDKLQEAAAYEVGMCDPVFALDESKGSILSVFQVLAATATLAVALGCWFFTSTLVRSGVVRSADVIELITVNKTHDDKQSKLVIQSSYMEEANT